MLYFKSYDIKCEITYQIIVKMNSCEKEYAVGLIIVYEYFRKKKQKVKKKRNRKIWVKTWLKNREAQSAYNNLFSELWLRDEEEFRRYLRINTETRRVGRKN